MDGLRPSPAQFLHDLAAGGGPHDRVVDEHDALSLEDIAERVELQLDADVPQALVRLDEGARDVAALDQPLAVRDNARLGEADSGRRPRVRERDDDVGIGGRLAAAMAAPAVARRLESAPPAHGG